MANTLNTLLARQQIPKQPNPEPPGFNNMRAAMMQRYFQQMANPYGLSGNGPPPNMGQMRPYNPYGGGGGRGGGMGQRRHFGQRTQAPQPQPQPMPNGGPQYANPSPVEPQPTQGGIAPLLQQLLARIMPQNANPGQRIGSQTPGPRGRPMEPGVPAVDVEPPKEQVDRAETPPIVDRQRDMNYDGQPMYDAITSQHNPSSGHRWRGSDAARRRVNMPWRNQNRWSPPVNGQASSGIQNGGGSTVGPQNGSVPGYSAANWNGVPLTGPAGGYRNIDHNPVNYDDQGNAQLLTWGQSSQGNWTPPPQSLRGSGYHDPVQEGSIVADDKGGFQKWVTGQGYVPTQEKPSWYQQGVQGNDPYATGGGSGQPTPNEGIPRLPDPPTGGGQGGLPQRGQPQVVGFRDGQAGGPPPAEAPAGGTMGPRTQTPGVVGPRPGLGNEQQTPGNPMAPTLENGRGRTDDYGVAYDGRKEASGHLKTHGDILKRVLPMLLMGGSPQQPGMGRGRM